MAEDSRIFLGIGSNIEDRYLNIKKGSQLLHMHPHIWVINKSYIYNSPPMYHIKQQDFYNMVIEIETNLNPLELLDEIKIVERKMGRDMDVERNMPRELDIDILVIGDLLINSKTLKIPHPKIAERKFVLKPWSDIAPKYLVPNLNKYVKDLLVLTKDRSSVKRMLILDEEIL